MWESLTNLFSSDATNDEASLKVKFEEAKRATEKLQATQAQVDTMLERMRALPEHRDLFLKLDAAKNDSRGFFSEYVQPAWQKIIDAYDYVMGNPEAQAMGFPPLMIAGVAGAAALIALCIAYASTANEAWEREQAILNDPSIPADLKRQLLSGQGISGILSNTKALVLVGAGSIAVLMILRTVLNQEKRRSLVKDTGDFVSSAKMQSRLLAQRARAEYNKLRKR